MITFILGSLNDLNIFAYGIGNVQLNNKYREKLWTEAGTEFGTEKVMLMIIPRALYGINSSGTTQTKKLSETLKLLG